MTTPRSIVAVLLVALASCGTEGDDLFFVRSRGADMPVWVRGNTSSRTMLVFLHGGPGGTAIYYAEDPAFERLSKKYAIAYWDQRAAGSSQGNAQPETISLDQYATDLGLVVDVLAARHGPKRIILMGWSFGGAIATVFLGDPARQARIAGYVDMAGAHTGRFLQSSRSWAVNAAQERIDQSKDAKHWRGELAWYEGHPTLSTAEIKRHSTNVSDLGGALRHPEKGRGVGSLWLNMATPFAGLATMSNSAYTLDAVIDGTARLDFVHYDLSAEMARITLPTLLVWGRHDGQVPLDIGQEAQTLLGTPADQKSLLVLEDAAHAAFTDEPDALAGAVEAFIDALP